jgi:hypothetical protein
LIIDWLDSVKLPKSFIAVNLSEKVPHAFGMTAVEDDEGNDHQENTNELAQLEHRSSIPRDSDATLLKDDGVSPKDFKAPATPVLEGKTQVTPNPVENEAPEEASPEAQEYHEAKTKDEVANEEKIDLKI